MMMKNALVNNICFVFFSLVIVCSCKQDSQKLTNSSFENTILEGAIFGTYYRVTYNSEVNYQKQLDSLFYVINKSMSTYQINSDISKLNRNEAVEIDEHFKTVFTVSKSIYEATKGAFDPTIGAVVNAWDFGPEGKIENLDSLKIKNLMVSVGFNKVELVNNNINKPEATFIDFNAIAKGYAVDVIVTFLEHRNIKNHLVDIGGELRASGINAKKQLAWRVGIQDPKIVAEESRGKPISLINASMATSGTYRKFKIDKSGNRYAHIIDTETGYPSKTNLLSISVIAEDCITADAYATAFKTMGVEKVKHFLKIHPELKVFLIFENDKKELETLSLNGFPEN